MKSAGFVLSVLSAVVSIAVILLFPGTALPAEGGETLSILIEKAVEREAQFNNVKAEFSYKTAGRQGRGGGFGGGRRRGDESGDAPAAESRQRTDSGLSGGENAGERRGQRGRNAGRWGWGGTSTANASWAKSEANSLITVERSREGSEGESIRQVFQSATNSEGSEGFFSTPDGTRGYISPGGAGWAGRGGRGFSREITPDKLGVTALPTGGATLLDRLRGESFEFSRERDGETFTMKTSWEPLYVGEEMVGDILCAVVEVTQTTLRGSWESQSVERIYFSPDLNYAAVAVEQGRKRDGEFEARSRWDFGDFREVKDGLFMPFSATSDRMRRSGEAQRTVTYNLLKLEFVDEFEDGFFHVEFPPGTIVRDRVAGTSYTTGESEEEVQDVIDEMDALLPAAEDAPPEPAAAIKTDMPAQTPVKEAEGGEGGRFPWRTVVLVLAAMVPVGTAISLIFSKRRK